MFDFQTRQTLQAPSEAVAVAADRDCPEICACRELTTYISGQPLSANTTTASLELQGGWVLRYRGSTFPLFCFLNDGAP